jgi:hypothetical protein
MSDTEKKWIPAAEAYRLAFGKEPPPPLEGEKLRKFREDLERAHADARRIWGDETIGRPGDTT